MTLQDIVQDRSTSHREEERPRHVGPGQRGLRGRYTRHFRLRTGRAIHVGLSIPQANLVREMSQEYDACAAGENQAMTAAARRVDAIRAALQEYLSNKTGGGRHHRGPHYCPSRAKRSPLSQPWEVQDPVVGFA